MNAWSPQQQAIFEWFRSGRGNLVVRARAGCLAGDTLISINRNGKGWSLPLAELVAKQNGLPWKVRRSEGHLTTARGWDLDLPTFVQREHNGVIRLGRLLNAWRSGEKLTHSILTKSGKVIRATAEHPFLTENGWAVLDDLHDGLAVQVRSTQKLNGPAPKKAYPDISGLWFHPFAAKRSADKTHRYGSARVPLHRLVAEADWNELQLNDFLDLIFAGRTEGLKFLDPSIWAVHHKDRNPWNNSRANLETLLIGEHRRLHADEGTDENVLFKVQAEKIARIKKFKVEETFDIEVADDPHNFVANGFVVHNTGKTTTIVEGITYAPENSIMMCAFNKKIATELGGRLRNPNAEAKTLHAIGFGLVRNNWSGIRTDEDRGENLARKALRPNAPDRVVRLVAQIASKGKAMCPFPKPGDLAEIAMAFDHIPDPDLEFAGWTLDVLDKAASDAMAMAAEKDGTIDFDDMVYLPIRNRWIRGRYNLVCVDECQDMNATQIMLAQGIVNPNGRLAVIGDDCQAIYAFRGADSGSLDRLKAELNASELGLTITYRCPKSVVALAAALVPDFQAAPSAPAGTISDVTFEQLISAAQPGDFVLSRKNAPLAKICLSMLRSGKRARIEGRDIGSGLVALVRRLHAANMLDFEAKLESWEMREIERARASKKKSAEARIEFVADQAETLRSISDGLTSPEELEARITALFEGGTGAPSVICSSVHRAKGLESDRCFIIGGTFYPGGRQTQEERNIHYVAVTRTKSTLVWVDGEASPERNRRERDEEAAL